MKAPVFVKAADDFFNSVSEKKEKCIELIGLVQRHGERVGKLKDAQDPQYKKEKEKLDGLIAEFIAETNELMAVLCYMIEMENSFKFTFNTFHAARCLIEEEKGEI